MAVSVGVAVVVMTGLTVVLAARWGPDWPAQEFRAWIARHDGLSTYTLRWYSGTALPGYSVLYPVVSLALSPGIVGLASCVAITACAGRFVSGLSTARALLVEAAVGVSVVENLLIGQVPFLLGGAFGAAAVTALLGGKRRVTVAVLATLSTLSSPLAGLFLLLCLPALARRLTLARAAALAPAGLGAIVAGLVGGAGGPFPCPWQTFAGVLAFCGAVLVLLPSGYPGLRTFATCYLVLDLAAFTVPNPVGGNVDRLAKLLAIPFAFYFLPLAGRTIVTKLGPAAVASIAVLWPSAPFVSCIVHGASDPSQAPGYYTALDRYLARTLPPGQRVEVPFTREHWEALYVADRVPIARGWERQTDLKYNAVLYHPLGAARYHRWLADNAVAFVALPTAPKDVGGQAETTLLAHPLDYLVPVWQDRNWQVWRVTSPAPIVSGEASLVEQNAAGLTISFTGPGTAVVRVRASKLWTSRDPGSCIDRTVNGWLTVTSDRPGRVHLKPSLNASIFTTVHDCPSVVGP